MKSRRFPLATRLLSVFVMTSYIVYLQAPARAASLTTPTKLTNGGKKWVIQLAFRPVIGATPAPKDGATPAPKDGAMPAPKDSATPAPKDYDPSGFLVGSHGNYKMTEYGSKEVGLTDRATIAMVAYVPNRQIDQIDHLYLDVGADHWSTGQTSDTVTANAVALAYFVELNDAGAIVDSCWKYDSVNITDTLTTPTTPTSSGHTLSWRGSKNSPPPYGFPLYATVAKICP